MPATTNYPANGHTVSSAALTELVTSRPSFIVRWGISFFLLLLVLAGMICWLISYPETVTAQARLMTGNAPKPVIAKTDGRLVKLFVQEGQPVKKGDIVGYLESIASADDMLLLSSAMDTIQQLAETNPREIAAVIQHTDHLILGEVQPAYQAFNTAFIEYRDYIKAGYYEKRQAMLARDIQTLQALHHTLEEQQAMQTRDLALQQQTYDAHKKLKDEKVISPMELREEESKLISKRMSIPQSHAALISNRGQQNEKRKEVLQLQNDMAMQKTIFLQALHTLKSSVEEWKHTYILRSAIDGHVNFTSFLQENQPLKNGQLICMITPPGTEYFAEMYIPQNNLAKIKPGQKVLLKFPSYPYHEYGSLEGQLTYIAAISTDSGYFSRVSLPAGLVTNHNKQVLYRDGLKASAEIITENMSLLKRLYYKVIN